MNGANQRVNGSIKEINVSETSEFKDFHRTEDGKGYSFRKGERVKLTFNRKKGYELDKIVDPAKKDKNGNPLAVLEIIDDNTVKMVGLNDVSTTSSVTKNPDGTWGVATGEHVLRRSVRAWLQ